jgi:hypothetical protein
MLMMLRHPSDPKREEADHVVSTLTSIYRYLKYGTFNIPDRLTKVWSDAGFLTHGFRFWRYDSQGGNKSLMSQYGFKRLAPRKTDAVYGPGYVLAKSIQPKSSLDSQSIVEFRRAYLLVSNPKYGTLVIRNSSKEFGRDTMAHPAYFSPKALTSVDLKTFDIKNHLAQWPPEKTPISFSDEEPPNPNTDKFMSILDPRLYPTRMRPTEEGASAEKQILNRAIAPVETLMNELLKVKEDYRRWKFDTGAFKDKAFVGHESPGFRAVLDLAGHWSDFHELGVEKLPPPELAFVHPQYPPWESYRYTDKQGESQRTFKLTPDHVRELSQYVRGKLTDEALQQSDWYQFLKTGIRKKAELILLAPEIQAPNKETPDVKPA